MLNTYDVILWNRYDWTYFNYLRNVYTHCSGGLVVSLVAGELEVAGSIPRLPDSRPWNVCVCVCVTLLVRLCAVECGVSVSAWLAHLGWDWPPPRPGIGWDGSTYNHLILMFTQRGSTYQACFGMVFRY